MLATELPCLTVSQVKTILLFVLICPDGSTHLRYSGSVGIEHLGKIILQTIDFWVAVINPRAHRFGAPCLQNHSPSSHRPRCPKEAPAGWIPRYMHIGDLKKVEWIRQRVPCCIQPDHLNTAGSFQHQKAKQQKKPSENLKHPTILSQVVTVTLAKLKETSVLRPKWPEKGL